MGITLFEHNRTAYQAVMEMIEETGKAAVIHPTGTGKSFIGFQLCADHPEQTVCWLSPSEYIFRTQMENLRQASGGYAPENIRFYTYARLILMTSRELEEIQPDYIILDEFHRCGAEVWGQGVSRLLCTYPRTPVVGLSATNIRYLDNRRDMADELFDGNVASEMTLGEAIVRGILNPPRYVLSIYSYRKDLEKYEARVQAARNKAARDVAEEYLEALRRALEKADGIDEIFHKHMTDRTGKYIVFCANHEHMKEMMEKVPEWFGRVDANPHVYSVYSDDPESGRSFDSFRTDESSHLKLLYCIDMLNEGIHVDGISGVILLRPTVSPIVYKQQIGRALSASKKKNAVIFDIVLNIESLYSVDAIEEEMQVTMTYYRSVGLSGDIVNEHFQITDEVRDCRELFNRLNDSLTASWSVMYRLAERYYKENGELEVPKRYVTEEGYSLGMWLYTQRQIRAGRTAGRLTEEQIRKLDTIGMRWENARDVSWERNYEEAKRYYKEHGNLLVSISDKKENGVSLGRWLAGLRIYRKNGIRNAYLTPERIRALDEIGMVWDVPNYLWEQNYHAAMEYHREHGNLDVPRDYISRDGIRLGVWITKIRGARQLQEQRRQKQEGQQTQRQEENRGKMVELTEEQIAKLDELDMVWDSRRNTSWEKSYEAAYCYWKEHGNLNIPATYVTEDGIRLGRWLRYQKDKGAGQSTLSEERKEKLRAIGMTWETEEPWERRYRLLERYKEEHGNLDIPPDYVAEGIWLGRWLSEQIRLLNKQKERNSGNRLATREDLQGQNEKGGETGKETAPVDQSISEATISKEKLLTPKQVAKLSVLGICPGAGRRDRSWNDQYEEVKAFYQENGHLSIPKRYVGKNGKNVGVWLQRQRTNRRQGRLRDEQVALLDAIGMKWDGRN